jgi:alpha-beta hydrolase superfamily lysophospholipase
MLIIRLLIIALAVYSLMVVYLYFFQEKLLFPASHDDFENCEEMKKEGAEPIRSEHLRYYFREAEKPQGLFILYHGNGDQACRRTEYFYSLKDLPLNIAVFEYPGYGDDKRKPSEESILKESLELFDLLQKQHPKLPIFIYGESLGSGISTYISSKRNVSGLILQSPYTSTADVAQKHYPYIPIKWLLKHRFEAKAWATNVKVSPLILIAERDDVIPPSISDKQVGNFLHKPETLLFKNAAHNTIAAFEPERFWGSIKGYISNTIENQTPN